MKQPSEKTTARVMSEVAKRLRVVIRRKLPRDLKYAVIVTNADGSLIGIDGTLSAAELTQGGVLSSLIETLDAGHYHCEDAMVHEDELAPPLRPERFNPPGCQAIGECPHVGDNAPNCNCAEAPDGTSN